MNIPFKPPSLFGEKRKGGEVELSLPLPFDYSVKGTFLGSGRFTSAFAVGKQVYLYVFYDDDSKEILCEARAAHGPDPYLPKIERLGLYPQAQHDIRVYKETKYIMPLIRPMGKPSKAWEQAQILEKAWNKVAKLAAGVDLIKHRMCKKYNMQIILQAQNLGADPKLITTLAHLKQTGQRFGRGFIFELRKGNMAINDKGHLILVDPLLNAEALRADTIRRMIRWRQHILEKALRIRNIPRAIAKRQTSFDKL